MTLKLALAAAILMAFSAAPARAQEAELIHSDAPLWTPGNDKVWPQHFTDGDSFGCVHRIRLGVWRYEATDGDFDNAWRRFENYGVFHCWMNVSDGDEPGSFGESRPGFLIQLGDAGGRELWALQLGARPGSDYLLLARSAGAGAIDRFEVLQRRCPAAQMRGGPSLDILLTRYCAINSRSEMLAMARRMARLPALGVMTFESDPPEVE
jgi:hypothetical protein